MPKSVGIPDMKFINRKISVMDIAKALDLRLDVNKIHCWHPDRHKNGDRTASVGIRSTNNTVKCFGCNSPPLGPIDFVIDVLQLNSPADAALWIAERFDVPTILATRPANSVRPWGRFGAHNIMGLLIGSGLWADLSAPAKAIAAILLDKAQEEAGPGERQVLVQMSYQTITRFAGVRSPNAIRKALLELEEIDFLKLTSKRASPTPPLLESGVYRIGLPSDGLWETAQAAAKRIQHEIEAEKDLGRRAAAARVQSSTKYKHLYSPNSGDRILRYSRNSDTSD
jgi:hypothetical protein